MIEIPCYQICFDTGCLLFDLSSTISCETLKVGKCRYQTIHLMEVYDTDCQWINDCGRHFMHGICIVYTSAAKEVSRCFNGKVKEIHIYEKGSDHWLTKEGGSLWAHGLYNDAGKLVEYKEWDVSGKLLKEDDYGYILRLARMNGVFD